MPYIITTGQRHSASGRFDQLSTRRAVATLNDAAGSVIAQVHEVAPAGSPARFDAEQAALRLPEAGGTIGPLPDGTVIEVERVDWSHIWGAVAPLADGMHAEAIDAYNEAVA